MDLGALPFDDLLSRIGDKSPTPGGGAVTAAVGALASALAQMAVAYSVGKKNLAEHQPELAAAAGALDRARRLLLGLAHEDMAAYAALNDLLRLPETDARRAAELPETAAAATRIPLALIAACADLLRLFERLASITNRHLRSDLAIAAVLADAAARASLWNVRVNLSLLRPHEAAEVESSAAAMLRQAAERLAVIESACL